MFNVFIKDFSEPVITLDKGIGSFEVDVLRCEINGDWDTQTFLCKFVEPFMLYNDEQTYIIFKTDLRGQVYHTGNIYGKDETKQVNKAYIDKLISQWVR